MRKAGARHAFPRSVDVEVAGERILQRPDAGARDVERARPREVVALYFGESTSL